jgi:hypothetical protein
MDVRRTAVQQHSCPTSCRSGIRGIAEAMLRSTTSAEQSLGKEDLAVENGAGQAGVEATRSHDMLRFVSPHRVPAFGETVLWHPHNANNLR